MKPKSGPGERSTATQEHVSGKNVATRIARESLRALVRTSVDGRRQVLATPAAARRRTGGEPSTINGVEIVVVAAVGTSAAKVTRRTTTANVTAGARAANVTGGAGDAQVTAETKLTWNGIANMLACAQQDPQYGGCAG